MTSNEDDGFDLHDAERYLDEFDLPAAEEYFNAIDVDYLPDEDAYFPFSATPAAAYHAVLYTAELLERILWQVDMTTLLLSQRTCVFWKRCIEASHLLQRALFFESEAIWDSRFIPASDGSHMLAAFYLDQFGMEPLRKPVLNPLAVKLFGALQESQGEAIHWKREDFHWHEQRNSSCLKMLLTQPAVNEVFLTYRSDHTESTCCVTNVNGVNAANVAEKLEMLMDRLGGQEISVEDIVGASLWLQMSHYSDIESVTDWATMMPPSQGLSFLPLESG